MELAHGRTGIHRAGARHDGLSGKELDRALKEQTSRHIRIVALTEQLPLQENRVTLDWNRVERAGLPGLEISYRLDTYTRGALAGARRMHEEMFQRLGVTSLWHKDSAEAAGHIMGTRGWARIHGGRSSIKTFTLTAIGICFSSARRSFQPVERPIRRSLSGRSRFAANPFLAAIAESAPPL
jgi:hypothetical protein